jgi:hypothetical protein
MIHHSLNTTNLRLLLPETLWLEPKHFDRAKEISDRPSHETQQWQAYLTVLARLAFETWLQERLVNRELIHPGSDELADGCYLRVGEFKVCLLATEHVLDEIVSIPKRMIEQPDLAAHLYVVLEVLEEQEQVVVRGFLRYDELVNQPSRTVSLQTDESQSTEWYVLPLSTLDAEINHLVIYIQYSEPSAIAMPMAVSQPIEIPAPPNISGITRLSQWLQGVLDEGWQAIDTLIHPEMNLALSTRHLASGAKGGKLINLGMQLGEQTVVLLVTVTPENQGKIGINIQVLPAAGATVLSAQLKLTLLFRTNKILQEVQSRTHDNYIQLKPFKGKPGTGFSVEVNLNDICVRETFEL